MGLFGALSLGGSSLAANQAALQVTGNNIANAGTTGYTRQTVNLAPLGDSQVTANQTTGNGVTVTSIERQTNETINENLRDATSDQNAAQTLNSFLTQLQSTFGALNDGDLASQLTNFFGNFSSLANNPTSDTLRNQVVQSGVSVSQYLQNLRSQLSTQQTGLNNQVSTLTTQANALLQQVADLNKQIGQSGPTGISSLLDARDQTLSKLSQLVNITTVDQPSGMVNVLIGNQLAVSGTSSRGLKTTQVSDPTGKFSQTYVAFADTGDVANVSGGQLGGTINARDSYVTPAISTVDTIAAGLINAVNTVHSQGQGLAGFSSVTGTTAVLDPTLPLNGATSQTGIAFPPANGTFNLYLTDKATGQVTTQQVNVNLSGQGTQTTLNSLAASITTAGGGAVSASVNAAGNLVITSSDPNVTFGFGSDTSGVLAALGINTFFTGSDAKTIGVNNALQQDTNLLATGRNNVAGSNTNAQALSIAGAAAVSLLGGQSVADYYTSYIGNLATKAQNANTDLTATTTLQQTLTAQQQAVSGVSMDEEAINMMQYQRAFEGSARFISTINQMMQDVLNLVQ